MGAFRLVGHRLSHGEQLDLSRGTRLVVRQAKAKAEAARRAREEAARQAAARSQLEKALAQEAAGRQAAANQRALAGYIQAIRNKAEANWIRPPGAKDVTCKVHVKQLPGGQVVNVRVVNSCGGPALDRSVEQAIRIRTGETGSEAL